MNLPDTGPSRACQTNGDKGQTYSTGESGEALLLAPLDSSAESAITRALELSSYTFERRGSIIELRMERNQLATIGAMLSTRVPRTLQSRVKGVFGCADADPHEMLEAFIHAEPLPLFFEQSEVSWVEDALAGGWLFSVFQPIVCATEDTVFAYEALIRAKNPASDELISAGQLIHACNRLNLQHQLDQQARHCAIRDAASLNMPGARFFINFLPNVIYDPEASLRSTLAEAERHGIVLSQLVFEVVETEQIEDPARLRTILNSYRERGAGIALDDIGSGFSSLQYLTDLMPDYVKIDRHIVSGATGNASIRHTLESIVGLARKLNVKVVAEGVETEDEMTVAIEAGVDYLQGYLFASPAYPPATIRPRPAIRLKDAA